MLKLFCLSSPPCLLHQGVLYHGSFWTVWKLCQGLANLTVNDRNKVRTCMQLLGSWGCWEGGQRPTGTRVSV